MMTAMCHNQRAWATLSPIQSLLTLSTPLKAPARMCPPPLVGPKATPSQVN